MGGIWTPGESYGAGDKIVKVRWQGLRVPVSTARRRHLACHWFERERYQTPQDNDKATQRSGVINQTTVGEGHLYQNYVCPVLCEFLLRCSKWKINKPGIQHVHKHKKFISD